MKPKRKDSVRRWTSTTGRRERKTPSDAPASLTPATGRAAAQRRQSQGDGAKAIEIEAGCKAPCADCRDKPSGEVVLLLAWAWLCPHGRVPPTEGAMSLIELGKVA